MALTKPKAAQINFDLTNFSDPIIRLNSNKTQTNDTDVGFIFERGSTGDNAVIIWDESADQFVIGTTTATGNSGGNLQTTAAALSIGSLTLGGTAVTSTAAELNLLDGVTALTLGSANEIAIVDSDGTGLTTTSVLTIDNSNNYIGINQTSPEVTLHMTGEDAQTAQIRMEQYNNSADAPDIRTRRYRGTAASPLAVNSGDYLFRSNHEYWNGTSIVTGGSFAFDNTNNAARTEYRIAVDTDGTGADVLNGEQFKIDGNDGGAITFNDAYKFPTADGSANQFLQTDGAGAVTFASATVSDISDLTATATELNYTDGVTSNIQTQLDARLALSGGTMTGDIVLPADGTIGAASDASFIKFNETSTAYSGHDLSIGSNQSVHVLLDMNNDGNSTGGFTVRTGATSVDTSTELFKVNGDGAILADGAYDFDIASHDGTNGLKLGGTLITATATEINYLDGVTSNIQTQIDGISGGISNVVEDTTPQLGGNLDGQAFNITTTGTITYGTLNDGTTALTSTVAELNYVDGVTSAIQTQIDGKASLSGATFTGAVSGTDLTLSGDLTVNGTTTTVNTTNLVVTDNLIELNNGAASNANDSGIVIERGSTGDNAIIAWDESADTFILGTTTATGTSTGDLTVTAGTLNIGTLQLSGTSVTATATELNLLDGVTATTAEINYLDGVTSNIQTQIDNAGGITEAQAIEYAIALG